MPAITRSQARQLINSLKTSSYSVNVRDRAKSKQSEISSKLEELLDRDVTPNSDDIIGAFLELSKISMDAHDLLQR